MNSSVLPNAYGLVVRELAAKGTNVTGNEALELKVTWLLWQFNSQGGLDTDQLVRRVVDTVLGDEGLGCKESNPVSS